MRLVLASNNAKKLAELQALLAPAGVELVAQGTLGVDEADEPFATFVENALAKARHASARTGLPALADDSGLCVDALGGAPGVRSARFATLASAGPEAAGAGRESLRRRQDDANNALLLERLAGVAERRARFVATLVAVRRADDSEPLIAVGRWHGRVLEAPRGEAGFGYDPLFIVPELGATAAELGATGRKNAISHRAIAAAAMVEAIRTGWHNVAGG